MNSLKRIMLFTIALFVVTSCEEEPMDSQGTGYDTTGGAIVVNEGGFQNNNGSISYVSTEGVITNNIFATANGVNLGDVVTSYLKAGDKGIIIVNNSQKAEVVDAATFNSISTITQGLTYPRFALEVSSSKLYITNGSGDGTVIVVNMDDYTVSTTIDVGQGPNELLAINSKVYVANSGGFGDDSTISVIDPDTDQEIEKITVGKNPEALVVDANGKLWALCVGTQDFTNWPDVTMLTPSKLVQINPASNTIEKEVTIVPKDGMGDVERLAISTDGMTLYYTKDTEIYKIDIGANTVSAQPFITGTFYGLDVNPTTGEIWAATLGFTENQEIQVYSATGALVSTYDVGIATSSSNFNE